MRDFIAENAKFILDFGLYILGAGILVCLFIIYLIGRKQKYFLPNSFGGWIGSILSFILLIIFSLAITGLAQEKATTGKVLDQFESLVGKKAPILTFNIVGNDSTDNLENYEGNIILLNFWATWCGPCLEEMPDLSKLQKDFAEDGVVVITLSDEGRGLLLNHLEKHPNNTLSVYNQQIEWIDIKIGTTRPITFFIDRNGIIKEYYTGSRDYDFFASKIKELL